MDERGVRLRPPRRRLRDGLVDAAAEEEPRHRRAGAGQGRPPASATSPACSRRSRGCRSPTTATCRRTRSRCSTPSTRSSLALAAIAGMIDSATFDTQRMAAAADVETIAATDLAEWLVARGTPFREAHALVGNLVRRHLDERHAAGRAGRRRPGARTGGRRARRSRGGGVAADVAGRSRAARDRAAARGVPGDARRRRWRRSIASPAADPDAVPPQPPRPLRRVRHAGHRVQRPLPRLLRRRLRGVARRRRCPARWSTSATTARSTSGQEGRRDLARHRALSGDRRHRLLGRAVGHEQLRRALRGIRRRAERFDVVVTYVNVAPGHARAGTCRRRRRRPRSASAD